MHMIIIDNISNDPPDTLGIRGFHCGYEFYVYSLIRIRRKNPDDDILSVIQSCSSRADEGSIFLGYGLESCSVVNNICPDTNLCKL